MNEVDKNYECKLLNMVINQYLDQIISANEESLKNLENKQDEIVWDLATKIYTQSGHKVELSTVRDVVSSRIKATKYQLAIEKKRIALQAMLIAQEKARQEAAEQAHFREEINTILEEFGGDEGKAKVFLRVQKLIIEELEVERNRVTLDSHIVDDLLADELDTVELAMALEYEFDMELDIPDDMLGSVKRWPPSYNNTFGDYDPVGCTVRELLNFIYEKISTL